MSSSITSRGLITPSVVPPVISSSVLVSQSESTTLIDAINKGKEDQVAALLESGADPNEVITLPNGSTTTPFFEAVMRKNEKLVALLLDNGADPNKELRVSDGSSRTPLQDIVVKHRASFIVKGPTAAAFKASPSLIQLLLQKGANPYQEIRQKDGSTSTPFYQFMARGMASGEENIQLAELFLKFCPGPKAIRDGAVSTALYEAINTRNVEVIKLLLEARADPNNEIRQADGSFITPLCAAIETGDTNVIELLFKAGADPNKQAARIPVIFRRKSYISTKTPLYIAINKGNKALVELLLKAGAFLSGTAFSQPVKASLAGSDTIPSKETPLYTAVKLNKADIIDLLLKYGADPNEKSTIQGPIKSKYDATALGMAMDMQLSNDIIRSLLIAGANPCEESYNAGNYRRITPFEQAIERDNLELLGIFFALSEYELDVQKGIEHAKKTTIFTLSPEQRKALREELAKALPFKNKKNTLRFGSKWVFKRLREAFLEKTIQPILDSDNQFIKPLVVFLEKATKDEDQFYILLKKMGHDEWVDGRMCAGYYSRFSKNISILIDMDENEIAFEKAIDQAISEMPRDVSATFCHEAMHKAVDGMSWHHPGLNAAALKDITALEADGWKCDAFIQNCLQSVSSYSGEKRSEEYLVRVAEMLVEIQRKSGCSSEEAISIVKGAIPNLFKIYEEEFIPALISHNIRFGTNQVQTMP